MKSPVAKKNHRGVIVPVVTPITADGSLDEAAFERIIDHLADGKVHGVFVLGTTGEAHAVPLPMRIQLVELVMKLVRGRMRVYAGISSESVADSVTAGNLYLAVGVDAVVAHVPASYEAHPEKSAQYFTELASQLQGDLIIYNMPLTTKVSLPIDVCKKTAGKPRVIGIKDSENNAARLGELLREMKGDESFSIFVGNGSLMAMGLLQGADGIVPSVGNIAPGLCREFCDSATSGDTRKTEQLHGQLMELAHIYQKGRTLGESLAALKGAMSWLGLCGPHVFPPLIPTNTSERLAMRGELARLGVSVQDDNFNEAATNHRPHNGRPGGSRAGALPADSQQS